MAEKPKVQFRMMMEANPVETRAIATAETTPVIAENRTSARG
jgi:hypothetical protein